MLSNWIQVWFRNLQRYKLYTFINVAGLSLGICAVIAIYIYISDELSYDKFHENETRIYRVNYTSRFGDSENRYFTTPATLGDAARTDITGIRKIARLFARQGSIQVGNSGGQKFREPNVYFADPDVFGIFSFVFLAGDSKSPLANPNQLVICREVALKYFGSVEAAVGKEVLFEGHLPLTVSAVIENYPDQSHLNIDLIGHFENFYNEESENIRTYLRTDWLYNPVSTYVLLDDDANASKVAGELNELKSKRADERVAKNVTFELQPLRDIHLWSRFTFAEGSSAIQYVYILASIGALILLIACVNFVNLSNAHSLRRAREIGIRKVLGARKNGLIAQFLGESGAVVGLSFLLAFIILYLFLPSINLISGKHFTLANLLTLKILGAIFILFILTSFLAGTYPSLYVTRFNPVVVLKGIVGHKFSEGYRLRKALMIFQFTISVTLVVLALVFYGQMEFIRDKPLGFQRENILTVPLFSETPNSILGGGVDGPLRVRMNTFEAELLKNSAVEAVTVSSGLPGSGAVRALVQTDKLKSQDNVFMAAIAVDYDFIDAYKMQILAGRDFSRQSGTDHLQAFIINEQALKELGWTTPENAIGQHLEIMDKPGSVVGVVKDFHFQGLQQPLRPLILEVAASKFTVFSIRLHPETSLSSGIETIGSEWNKTFPERVFEFNFLDSMLELNYGNEKRMVSLMEYFSILAVFISGLGLFGLTAYINYQRAKEVSIRKILGATVGQVFYVLSKEYLKMIGLAFLISVPLAFFLASNWLSSFSYRVDVGLLPFAMGASVAVATVLITISYETFKTARINPVDKLRNE